MCQVCSVSEHDLIIIMAKSMVAYKGQRALQNKFHSVSVSVLSLNLCFSFCCMCALFLS